MARNRQWILKRRPQGRTVADDFELRDAAFVAPALAAGELLIRNMAFLCAPTIRNWMDPPGNSYFPSIPLGDPMRGPCAGRVLASANPEFPVGSRICTIGNWQDFDVVSQERAVIRGIPEGYTFIDALGALGLNALTAYVGLHAIAEARAGETLLVSGAAGSVGSNAVQIGKILGCRVVGIAGGPRKCAWLLDNGCVDVCIDYKNEDVATRIGELCPDGIDVYFDNVGGSALQAAIDAMRKGGRIVLCGQISTYNDGGGDCNRDTRIGNLMRLVYGGIRMQGFLASQYKHLFPAAMADLASWIAQGRLRHREDVRQGIEILPMALNDLFEGANEGTLIVQIDPAASQIC